MTFKGGQQDVGKGNMMGEWRGWTWGARGEGETGPVSDKGRYNQVITSDKIEEEKEKRGGVLGEAEGQEG